MCHINESPVLLKLNPVAGRTNEVSLEFKPVKLMHVSSDDLQIREVEERSYTVYVMSTLSKLDVVMWSKITV